MTEFLSSARQLPVFFGPWVELAHRLGFTELARKLRVLVSPSDRRPELPMVCWWHQEATVRNETSLLARRLRSWFSREVIPLVEQARASAVRPAALDLLGPPPKGAREQTKPRVVGQ